MKYINIFVILAVIIAGGYIFLSKNNQISLPNVDSNKTTQPTIDNSDLKAGGSSYGDPQGVYSFLYPAEYKLDKDADNRVRIYKTGATQKGQTEMYDGVIIVFEKISLDGKSLSSWVDDTLNTFIKDGNSEIVEPKKGIMQNSYPGFTYSVRGLGVANYTILQKDSKSDYAVLISYLVSDPENVGFQKEVDKILSTLELFK